MRQFIFILLLSIAFPGGLFTIQAQTYDFGIGPQIGLAPGITAKYFLRLHKAIQPRSALEGIVSFRFKGAGGTLLYEYHIDVFDTEGFYMYFGGGVHIAAWNSDEVVWETDNNGKNIYAGINGIIGLEYVLSHFPLTIGLSWKPGVNLITDRNLMIDDISLYIRWTFD